MLLFENFGKKKNSKIEMNKKIKTNLQSLHHPIKLYKYHHVMYHRDLLLSFLLNKTKMFHRKQKNLKKFTNKKKIQSLSTFSKSNNYNDNEFNTPLNLYHIFIVSIGEKSTLLRHTLTPSL